MAGVDGRGERFVIVNEAKFRSVCGMDPAEAELWSVRYRFEITNVVEFD